MNDTRIEGRKRVAIFTEDDKIWSLPTWIHTIPRLIKNHDVIGIFVFPERLGKLKGIQTYLWYLRVFGFSNFLIMGIYALKRRFILLMSSIHGWRQLAKKYNLELLSADTPNSETVIKWTRNNNIDVIFIMVNTILREDIISCPNIGIINKHSAMLPSCKGVFPFFWGKLTNAPNGITFHQVNTRVDAGKILIQKEYPQTESDMSMLRFYIDVFNLYPKLAELALNKLLAYEYMKPLKKVKPSYFSFPKKSDYKNYREKSFKIACISDLFYKSPIDPNE